MSLVINLSKLHLYSAVIFLILSARFIITDATYDYVTRSCYDDETYALKASFTSDLNRLLSSLPEKAGQSINHGYYATNSTDSAASDAEIIYVLFLCRGDTTSDDCKGCVSAATDKIQSECPKAKRAVIWYGECMVRYSNTSYLGDVDEFIKVGWRSIESVEDSDVNRFMKLAGDTLYDLVSDIGKSEGVGDKKYYLTKGGVDFNSFMKLYNGVQCTPDLTPIDCQRCLKIMLTKMATYCYGNKGCRVLNPSCNIRYEFYQFYADTASPPPATSLSSPTQPIKALVIIH